MRNRNNGRNRSKPRSPEVRDPVVPRLTGDPPICPLCDKPVKDIYAAIGHRNTGQPSHFECVLSELAATETLALGERVCYLGAGYFGVVEDAGKGANVKRRIKYENKDPGQTWRKNFSFNIQ